MKTSKLAVAVMSGIAVSCAIFYIAVNRPRFSFGRQYASFMLTEGRYRSWSVHFCDGLTEVEGRWKPCVIEGDRLRIGYYRFPKFRHLDMKDYPSLNK